jgi:hypothetical protein
VDAGWVYPAGEKFSWRALADALAAADGDASRR